MLTGDTLRHKDSSSRGSEGLPTGCWQPSALGRPCLSPSMSPADPAMTIGELLFRFDLDHALFLKRTDLICRKCYHPAAVSRPCFLHAIVCQGHACDALIIFTEVCNHREDSLDGLPGWRSTAHLAQLAQAVRSVPAPPAGYQPQNLIKTIESRLRDGVTGDSQQILQSRDDAYYASQLSPTQVDGTIEKDETAEEAIPQSFYSKAPEKSSSEQAPAEDSEATAKLPAAAKNGTGEVRNADIVLVLSIDDNLQQLHDTAALWQVSSL